MQTFENLNRASSSLNTLLNTETGPLAATLNNASQMMLELRRNTANIDTTISNAKAMSQKLAALQLQPPIDSLNNLVSTLKSTANRIASKDGTLGALLNDKTLYNKRYDAILGVEILVDDLRTNPKRYVNLSIFGRKDKNGPITSPAPKDSVPSRDK
jgi:phospholipid/cholesterol/gamma-HCH transport system substrate-binding protein